MWSLRKLSLTTLAVFAVGAAAPAQAQSIYGEGPFAANFVGYAEDDEPPLEIGPGQLLGHTDSTLTAMDAEGAAFLHNKTGRCLGTWQIDEPAATFEQHVRCTYTDADGDRIFEQADFEKQPLDGPTVGTGQWTGGTGKYAGISGRFEIRARDLRSAREGLVQYVGTKQGHYKLVRPE